MHWSVRTLAQPGARRFNAQSPNFSIGAPAPSSYGHTGMAATGFAYQHAADSVTQSTGPVDEWPHTQYLTTVPRFGSIERRRHPIAVQFFLRRRFATGPRTCIGMFWAICLI